LANGSTVLAGTGVIVGDLTPLLATAQTFWNSKKQDPGSAPASFDAKPMPAQFSILF
jgi:hypothetical protein